MTPEDDRFEHFGLVPGPLRGSVCQAVEANDYPNVKSVIRHALKLADAEKLVRQASETNNQATARAWIAYSLDRWARRRQSELSLLRELYEESRNVIKRGEGNPNVIDDLRHRIGATIDDPHPGRRRGRS